MNTPPLPKTIAIDLDGVLSAYRGNYQHKVIESPAAGAREFLINLRQAGYRIVVHSTRQCTHVEEWLFAHDLFDLVDHVQGSHQGKPLAHVYLDDRAVRFNGDFDAALAEIESFKAWWEKT